jgi:hypothetical protein
MENDNAERGTVKRIRQFYEDHQDACDFAMGVAGTVMAFTAGTIWMRRRMSSRINNVPLTADYWTLDGGGASMISVNMSDGTSHHLFKEVAEAVTDGLG